MSNQINYERWLSEINESNSNYEPLFAEREANPPIFFFGDPERATAATVGVNPSATEFENRRWPEECELNYLLERCRNYFGKPMGAPTHQWFQTWELFLEEMGISYHNSPGAIHLDFSPRATRSMSSLQREPEQIQNLFLDLIENDLRYFVGQIRAYPSIKHLYVAGAVTRKYYAIEFLRKNAQHLGYALKPIVPFERGGPGQVGLYVLDLGDATPRHLFFCSTSPSARNPRSKVLLLQRAKWLMEKYPKFVPYDY
ncbi:MAG TPA: hypothetical protein VK487_00705 [Candidatus Bathyarchaeia archaeon]|nr:hypothetical protein [Candidatus Bathyarchaeia archaeon]